jgi:aspartate--ammonia ligase
MGIRVTKESLVEQMKLADREDELAQPYHQMILNDEIPLSIGGGIGQSRLQMLLLRKAHLGEVSTTVWPRQLHEVCEAKNIFVLK